ncbi:hypothetical protein QYF36_020673 [Acer negundo]|nr:hypothetical protein QYF36_020673 [Acer negundo]
MERIDWIRNKDMGNWAGIAQLNGFYRHQIPSILQLLLMMGPPIDMKMHLPFGWMGTGTAEDDLGDEGSLQCRRILGQLSSRSFHPTGCRKKRWGTSVSFRTVSIHSPGPVEQAFGYGEEDAGGTGAKESVYGSGSTRVQMLRERTRRRLVRWFLPPPIWACSRFFATGGLGKRGIRGLHWFTCSHGLPYRLLALGWALLLLGSVPSGSESLGLDVPVPLFLLMGNAQGIAWQVPSHWEGMKGQKLWDGKKMTRVLWLGNLLLLVTADRDQGGTALKHLFPGKGGNQSQVIGEFLIA